MTDAEIAVQPVAATFPPGAETPGLARRFLRQALIGQVDVSVVEVAQLLVSELVTNAVVHAASPVEVEVAVDETGVIVRVRDADTGPLVSRSGSTELDEGGRGFILIDRLAQSWGTEHGGGRKTVWFRLITGEAHPMSPPVRATQPPPDADSVTAEQRSLRTLVLRPNLQTGLTLREQLIELLARVVDAVGARGASVQLVSGPDRITTGTLATTAVPHAFELVIDDQRLGELTVALDTAISDDDEAFLRLAADRLALLALEHGVTRSEQNRGSEHDFMAETTELLAGSTSVALSLTLLTQIAVPRLAEWCAALSVDDRGRPRRLTANHRHEDRAAAVHAALDDDRELRQAILRAAGGGGPQRMSVTVSIAGRRAHVVALPLVSRARVLGVLALGSSEPFDPLTYMSAAELARRAGMAIETARLYEEQATTAAALQASLLPAALPVIDGLDLAARYHSASPGMSVGGDFYDAIVVDDGSVVLAIGDVCGKGAEAAAVTGMSRDLLRLLVEDGWEPMPALRRLNRALLTYPASSRFCTIALTQVRRDGDRLLARICLGGHPEPVVRRRDGTTELVGIPGDLLGVLEEDALALHESEIDLGVGDALVLYTDGVTERRDARRMFGQYGLRRTLANAAGASAEELANAIEQAAESFVDTELRDDLAILVLRRVS